MCPRDLERLRVRLCGDGDLDLGIGADIGDEGEEGVRFLGCCFMDDDLEMRTLLVGACSDG